MVGHVGLKAQAAEPPIGQVEVDLFAEPPFGADAEAVAHQQHADQKLGIHRWPPDRAVERRQVRAQLAQVHEPINRPQHMIGRDVPLDRELVEQSPLCDLPFAHHRLRPRPDHLSESAQPRLGNGPFSTE